MERYSPAEIPQLVKDIAKQMRESEVAYLKCDGIEIILQPPTPQAPTFDLPAEPATDTKAKRIVSGQYYHDSLWPDGQVPDYMKKTEDERQ